MNRIAPSARLLALLLLAGTLGGLLWRSSGTASARTSVTGPSTPIPVTVLSLAAPARASTPTPVAEDAPVSPTAPSPDGNTRQDSYRFSVRDGHIRLAAVQPLLGNFPRRRRSPDWQPGLWCIRLLAADQRVLAQETIPAADAPCVVLDPNVSPRSGESQAARLAGTGETMTQVRMPPMPGATWIRIYRLSGFDPADLDAEPAGELLATLPLSP